MVTPLPVTPRTWLLLSWIVMGAVVLTVHAVLVWQVVRSKDPPGRQRWWALLPPVAPYLAWKDRRWITLAVWAGALVAYVVLRALEG